MKKLFYFALAAAVFTACTDEYYETYEVVPTERVVDFESACLDEAGYLWGKDQAVELTEDDEEANVFGPESLYFYDGIYADGDAVFLSLYSDYKGLYGSAYDTWNGFVISDRTDMTTNSYDNDKSVYAESGADGSEQFAVAYYGKWTTPPYGIPTVRFTSAVKPVSVAVANTTLFYLYFKNEAAPAAAVDVKCVITGYNCGVRTGAVEVVLADAAGNVKTGWEQVDLSDLGTVTSLTFTIESTDSMCPYYLAIDNLTYGK